MPLAHSLVHYCFPALQRAGEVLANPGSLLPRVWPAREEDWLLYFVASEDTGARATNATSQLQRTGLHGAAHHPCVPQPQHSGIAAAHGGRRGSTKA